MQKLPGDLVRLLADGDAVKIVATTDERGAPHAVVKSSLTTLDGETLAYSEDHDGYISNRNLVRSIWFNRPVAVNVTKGAESYQVKGRPHRCLITGPVFQRFLLDARTARGPDAGIAAVWVIVPEEIRNESASVRQPEAARRQPFSSVHLDSLVRGPDREDRGRGEAGGRLVAPAGAEIA